MEEETSSYYRLGMVALATFIFCFVVKQFTARDHKPKRKLPPGPWKLPIIGSLHHLAGSLLPHRALLELSRRHGPVMLLRLGEVPTVVVSSPEAAAQVMSTHDVAFASRPRSLTFDIISCGGKGIVFAPYGDHWRQLRKVCVVELLSARQVRRVRSIREEEVARLVGDIASSARAGEVVNLSRAASSLAVNIIARAVFGGKGWRQEAYIREFDVLGALLGGFNPTDLFPSSRLVRWLSTAERETRRGFGRVRRILDEIIDERRRGRASAAEKPEEEDEEEDLLDVLLRLQKEDTLTFPITDEVIGVLLSDIFSAASDTTSTTLEWTMSELIRNQHIMERAKQEIEKVFGQGHSIISTTDLQELPYIQLIIKEVFRLHPAGPLLIRYTREDSQIMGYDIPKGTNVFINTFAIGRDHRLWNDVEEFKPERFANTNMDYRGTHFQFIPFGAGRRQCPGLLFGSATLELAVANLIHHFDWSLPDGASPLTIDMNEILGITLRRRSDLHVQAALRMPC
ncbi:hypothetical protein ACP70R_046444 [Stipagrostis hirtigluma subsp. patula]